VTDSNSKTVLVTGSSGFIGTHCVLQLLEQGYKVRGTVRDLDRVKDLRDIFSRHTQAADYLEFIQTDLLKDDGWEESVAGCEYVLHVASPFPNEMPENEDDLIRPAVDGTLRVLKAASEARVKRVVLTSSVAAIHGHHADGHALDESDWSEEVNESADAYAKSKMLAEKAAWDFVKNQAADHSLELVAINPCFVMGPLLYEASLGTSAKAIRVFLSGAYPGTARLSWFLVDVRDVAAAHLVAMTNPKASGNRYICASEAIWLTDVAKALNNNFAEQGFKISTVQFPNWFVKVYALFDKTVKGEVPNLGKEIRISNCKIKDELGMRFRSAEESVVAMGRSLIELGVL
jgi:nucleoside-diphosphate-sugar epimerase